jgi:DNA polymerase III delta subunit
LHPFPTRKLYAQAHRFNLNQLERVHRQLLESDVEIKTGRLDAVVALDLLIVYLARPN